MRLTLFLILLFIGGIAPGCARDSQPSTVYIQDTNGPALPPATTTQQWLRCYSPTGMLVWQGFTIATPTRGRYASGRWYHDILRPDNTFIRVHNAYSCVF